MSEGTSSAQAVAALRATYDAFRASKPPRRVGLACEDIQIEIDEYDGYVSGLVQSYLVGEPLSGAINQGEAIAERFAACEAQMAALKAHLELERRLASLLAECRPG